MWTPSIIIDSKKLETYLRLKSDYGDFRLIPQGANNVRVSDIKSLSGGMTNNINSFLLTFTDQGLEKRFELVLKVYAGLNGLWQRVCRPDEDCRRYEREFQVLRGLELVNFPVPKAYLCECDPFFFGYPFLIMSKEKVIQESSTRVDSFAATLANLHNLDVKQLGIKSLRLPKDDVAFAVERHICLKEYMNETRHYKVLKRVFNYAINWLELNIAKNKCSQYCLVHGEYHPGHALRTNDNTIEVIDWESVQIGDPAFDVGYAYHMVKLMHNEENSSEGEKTAERFISEYSRNFKGDINKRLEFYKIVGLLGVAIVVSSWISSPIEAYKRFGNKALARSLLYPIPNANSLFKRWINDDFLVNFLKYSVQYIDSTLK